MSFISLPRFFRSFRYALRGFRRAVASEHSFRIHVIVSVVVVVLIIALDLGRLETAVLVLVMANILILELVNTVVERFVGILEPRIHPYVGDIKDLMATGVLILSVAAILIGLVVLIPAIWP